MPPEETSLGEAGAATHQPKDTNADSDLDQEYFDLDGERLAILGPAITVRKTNLYIQKANACSVSSTQGLLLKNG